MSQVTNDLRAANEQAARAIELIGHSAGGEYQTTVQINSLTSMVSGAVSTTAGAADGIANAGTGAAAGSTATGDVARAAKVAGLAGAFGFNAVDRALKDAENPYYSNVERVARAATQSATVGGTAVTVGAFGAQVGRRIGGPYGMAVGTVGGSVGGYLLGEQIGHADDDLVDFVGERFDDLAENEDIAPW